MSTIKGISKVPVAPTIESAKPATSDDQFGNALSGAIDLATAAENTAQEAADRFIEGDPDMGIHEVMIATEKANVAVRFAVTLKNRAIEAYRELMRTPV